MEREERIVEALREQSRDFCRIEKLHEELDQSLREMTRRKVLPPFEELKKRDLQKKKLAAKDRMVEMIRRFKLAQKADETAKGGQATSLAAGK
ncbi:MAG: hypothetical protein WAO55_00615 [Candidatus Manganitrophaceae bacterium]